MATISQLKEQAITFQPLVLAEFTFLDGTTLRLSTHPLNTAQGGYQYAGQDYIARLADQTTATVQALSEAGVDLISEVTLRISDADKWIYTNYERTKGFRGAVVRLRLVFWNVGTSEFSSDSKIVFVGRCDGPAISDTHLSIHCSNLRSLQRCQLPTTRIQKTCPWIFPRTPAEREAAANDPGSKFWRCGYSPDVPGSYARGNGSFTNCNYTKEQCVARGMYTRDNMNRLTGRFGGIQWDPPGSWSGKSYLTGKDEEGKNSRNLAKYADFFPMVLGTQWVTPPVMNVKGNPNQTKFEVVVCDGFIGDGIIEVVCNGVIIPKAAHGNNTAWWNWVSRGGRDGAPNADTDYNSQGDPYGNLACIEVVVPKSLASSDSLPNVRVLVNGPNIRVIHTLYPFTVTFQYSTNPVWQILHILGLSGWTDDELDLQSFITAAGVCDEVIQHENLHGAIVNGPRFDTSLVIRDRKNAAEIVRGLRMACRAILVQTVDGKVQIRIKQTLAEQQSSPVAGSNDSSPYVSMSASGGATNGYVAYLFDSSTIARTTSGDTSLGIDTRPISDTPNKYTLKFQDRENNYAEDALTVTDTEDIVRVGQDIPATLPAEGVTTWDHAKRTAATMIAEGTRGNPTGAASGTYTFRWESSVRASHLRIGDIVAISSPKHTLDKQLVRLTSIQMSKNFERATLTGIWHDDFWYTDIYGQSPDPRFSRPKRDREPRPPYGWQPGYHAPVHASDPMVPQEYWNFGVAQVYEASADNLALARLRVSGKLPVNTFGIAPPPFVPLQGSVTPGGDIAGDRQICVRLAAKDADGKWSALSEPTMIDLPAGNASVTVPGIHWQENTAGYAAYAGVNPNRLPRQTEASGTPGSVTITALKPLTTGPPDSEFDKARITWTKIWHSGVWGAQIEAVGSNYIDIAGATFPADQCNGRIISLLGKYGSTDHVPIINMLVTDTAAGNRLTVNGNPVTLGLAVGDVLVLRAKPVVTVSGGDQVLTDPLWNNWQYPGLVPDIEAGKLCGILAGTGAGQFLKVKSNTETAHTLDGVFRIAPDATSVFVWTMANDSGTFTSDPQDISDGNVDSYFEFQIENLLHQPVLVKAKLLDGSNTESFPLDNPMREIYVWGSTMGGSSTAEGWKDNPGTDELTPELTDGFTHTLQLNRATTTILAPIYTAGTMGAGMRFDLILRQDITGGRLVNFHADYLLPSDFSYSPYPGAETVIAFKRQPDGKWFVRYWRLQRV